MSRHRLIIGAAILGAGIALVGCSQKNPHAPASVSGSISYNGQPIKAGTMQFHTQEGSPYDASISPDGTYMARDIPEGELVVTVNTEGLKKKGGASGKDAEKRMKMTQQPPPDGSSPPVDNSQYYVKIPAKYANAKTSPLTVNVKAGRQVHNIDLTD